MTRREKVAQIAHALAEATTEGLSIQEVAPTIANAPSTVKAIVVTDQRTIRTALVRWVTLGAFGGLVWGAALRAWMVVLVLQFGEQPHFTWRGTFAAILLPAALMGALLGGAAYLTLSSGQRRWRGVILAPLLLVLGPLLFTEGFMPTLLTTGLGSGAILVALIGVLGGYACSSFGKGWMRWGLGIFAGSLLIAAMVAGSGAANPPGAGDVFSTAYFVLLLAVLIVGVSLPSHLAATTQKPPIAVDQT
jgi:MFS family permease